MTVIHCASNKYWLTKTKIEKKEAYSWIFLKRQAKTNNLKNDVIVFNGRQQKRDSCMTHSETRYQGRNTFGYFPVEIGALIFALTDFTSDPVVEILPSNTGDMDWISG